ncbi:venom serine protease-like [Anopheles ziemanni]|uniref:venom serine protease-like n=1 Tax=Anopheles coustani TaxID=139045 RepID=UPI002659A727|nr:venom serine protease-like [Anopheles coustani]XP_058172212.1 venom serine protease-like [Anopheles ziemanni]
MLLALLGTVAAQYGTCDYIYNYNSGQTSTIESPKFPNYYTPGTKCRYTVNAPVGHYLYVQCYDMYLPASTGCYYDKLSVSLSGDSTLADAQQRCGTTTFNVQTSYNKLVVALLGSASTSGGRFKCQITALKIPCDCGRRKTRTIVGGTPTQANEFPMMAALLDSVSKKLFCGATIVTERFVLTAAHCLLGRVVSTTGILVGDQNIASSTDTPYSQVLLVSTFISNPGYNDTTRVNDIALVRTTNEIVFNPGVGRVCLPFRLSSSLFTGTRVSALGWGTIDFGAPTSSELLQTSLTVIAQGECSTKLSRTIQSSQICTFAAGNDTCQNDSGGPLYYTDPNNQLVYDVGVVGFGVACASNFPSVNARVTSYLDWIASTTGYTFCER